MQYKQRINEWNKSKSCLSESTVYADRKISFDTNLLWSSIEFMFNLHISNPIKFQFILQDLIPHHRYFHHPTNLQASHCPFRHFPRPHPPFAKFYVHRNQGPFNHHHDSHPHPTWDPHYPPTNTQVPYFLISSFIHLS